MAALEVLIADTQKRLPAHSTKPVAPVILVTFREFSEAGPLFYMFAENISKTRESSHLNQLFIPYLYLI